MYSIVAFLLIGTRSIFPWKVRRVKVDELLLNTQSRNNNKTERKRKKRNARNSCFSRPIIVAIH